MRAGFVNRTDLPKGLYIDDIEDTSRRNFSSQPKGQSRVLRRPTDAEVQSVLTAFALLSERGSDTGATKDTDPNDTLRIRASSSAPYTVITVTTDNALAVATLVNELNLAFINNGLPFTASVVGTNQVQIDTTSGDVSLDIDTVANGSTLNTALGFTDGVTVTPLTVAALRTAAYPTSTTIDVSTATITGLSTFSDLTTAQQTALVDAVADAIAPSFTETSLVLLSFSGGVLSKASASDFQPGGARIGLTAGPALAVLEDDGSTPFTL